MELLKNYSEQELRKYAEEFLLFECPLDDEGKVLDTVDESTYEVEFDISGLYPMQVARVLLSFDDALDELEAKYQDLIYEIKEQQAGGVEGVYQKVLDNLDDDDYGKMAVTERSETSNTRDYQLGGEVE